MEVNSHLHSPAALPTGKDPGSHRIGRYAGPPDVLDKRYLSLVREFEPRTRQHVGLEL